MSKVIIDCFENFFLECLLSGGQTVDLWSNMAYYRKSVKRAVECAFLCGTVALLVPELGADSPKNEDHIWPLVTSGDLIFDMTYKITYRLLLYLYIQNSACIRITVLHIAFIIPFSYFCLHAEKISIPGQIKWPRVRYLSPVKAKWLA